MNLSHADRIVLATHHGNTRECRSIRQRLQDESLKFRPGCSCIKSLAVFSTNGSGYLMSKCKRCTWRHRKRGTGYIPVASPERTAETTRLYLARHPERVHARDRAAYRARRDAGLTAYEASWQTYRDKQEPNPADLLADNEFE